MSYADLPPSIVQLCANFERAAAGRATFQLVPGITNRYCGPSFETATEPVIGRAFARPVGGLLRGCECISDLILRSLRSKHLEGWTQRKDSRPSFETRARARSSG